MACQETNVVIPESLRVFRRLIQPSDLVGDVDNYVQFLRAVSSALPVEAHSEAQSLDDTQNRAMAAVLSLDEVSAHIGDATHARVKFCLFGIDGGLSTFASAPAHLVVCVLDQTICVELCAFGATEVVTLAVGDVAVLAGSSLERIFVACVEGDRPALAAVFACGSSDSIDASLSLQKIGSVSMAKASQLACDWRLGKDGQAIDWQLSSASHHEVAVRAAAAEVASVREAAATAVASAQGDLAARRRAAAGGWPSVLKGTLKGPDGVLGCSASSFMQCIQSMSSALPMQMHFEPQLLQLGDVPEAAPSTLPIFRRAIGALGSCPEVAAVLQDVPQARLKMRISGRGKFIHRNRYPRVQAFCLLHGEMHWIFIDSQRNNGAADAFLRAVQTDDWNGYRSSEHPSMLSLEAMTQLKEQLPEGVDSTIVKMEAGDVLIFDGQWWHGTSYTETAMSMFVTGGKGMERAVKEHARRMKMKRQSKLKLYTLFSGVDPELRLPALASTGA